jgi:hypothetical protein
MMGLSAFSGVTGMEPLLFYFYWLVHFTPPPHPTQLGGSVLENHRDSRISIG